MTRLLLTLAVSILSALAPVHAIDWSVAVARTGASVASVQQYVTDPMTSVSTWETVCTAFSIDKNRQLFMTAAHCLADALRVDGQIAWLTMSDAGLDVAILQAPGARREAIVPRLGLPYPVGREVMAVGHAFGFEPTMARFGQVSNSYMLIPELKSSFMVVSTGFIGGMSGGPIVDVEGRLVGIVQRGSDAAGLGTPTDVLLKATRAFWPEDVLGVDDDLGAVLFHRGVLNH